MRPPDLQPDVLRIIPLGGLGDVGRNMSCYEINGEMLVIDCGVLFPEDDHPGVDLLLPGLDYLDEEKLARVKALVLTHGHEDHIGGVPFLLKQLNIPICFQFILLYPAAASAFSFVSHPYKSTGSMSFSCCN